MMLTLLLLALILFPRPTCRGKNGNLFREGSECEELLPRKAAGLRSLPATAITTESSGKRFSLKTKPTLTPFSRFEHLNKFEGCLFWGGDFGRFGTNCQSAPSSGNRHWCQDCGPTHLSCDVILGSLINITNVPFLGHTASASTFFHNLPLRPGTA